MWTSKQLVTVRKMGKKWEEEEEEEASANSIR